MNHENHNSTEDFPRERDTSKDDKSQPSEHQPSEENSSDEAQEEQDKQLETGEENPT
jgi:hypothetical protein